MAFAQRSLVPAEVVFDRYFRNELSAEEREVYKGKQDLDTLPDESTRLLLVDIQQSINNVYQAQKNRTAGGQSPNLHFDYVLADLANAIAFQHDGFAFVGVTMPMLDKVGGDCALLVAAVSVIGIFTTGDPTKHERRQLSTALFAILLQFVACHELGHHFHEHCATKEGSTVLWEEFAGYESDRAGVLNQTKELDADGFAVHMLLRNPVTGPSRSKFLELLGQAGDANDSPLLAALILAVGSFFFFDQRECGAEGVGQLTHPPAAVRVHFVMEELVGWLNEHRPSSSTSITLVRYQDLMGAVAKALSPKTSGKAWHDQTAFMLSEAGQEYLRRLSEADSQLRDDMRAKRWELDS